MLYIRIAFFNKDDQLRLYIYSDLLATNLSDASLNIALLESELRPEKLLKMLQIFRAFLI